MGVIDYIIIIILWLLVFIRGKRVIKDIWVAILSLINLVIVIFNCFKDLL